MRGDADLERRARDQEWAFESAVDGALAWLANSARWRHNKAVRFSSCVAAGALILAGSVESYGEDETVRIWPVREES